MFYIPPEQKRYPKTLAGYRQFALDWLNTPHVDERILPIWPLDLLCGLILLSPPLIARLLG